MIGPRGIMIRGKSQESFRGFYEYPQQGWARSFFRKRFARAAHGRLGPVRKVADMIRGYPDNIPTYCRQPATKAVAEGLHRRVMAGKCRASG